MLHRGYAAAPPANRWCRENCRILRARGESQLEFRRSRRSTRHGRSAEPGHAVQKAHRKETHRAGRTWWSPADAAAPGPAHFRKVRIMRKIASSTSRRVPAPTREEHPDTSLTLSYSMAFSSTSAHGWGPKRQRYRSEEHTSELQSLTNLV